MLGKLIKHDFKALSRTLIPAIIAIFGATLLVTVGLAYNVRTGFNLASDSIASSLLSTLSMSTMGLMGMAIVAAFCFIEVMIFQRFYKNFMSSEGYLTFTLPVKTSHLLWSKLITAMIWTLISAVLSVLCLFIFLLFGTATKGIVNVDILTGTAELCRQIFSQEGARTLVLEMLLSALVGSVAFVLQVYLAMTIGGAVAKKHKLLAGIGFYFLISTVTGIISIILQTIFSVFVVSSSSITDGLVDSSVAGSIINAILSVMQPAYWSSIILSAIYAVGFFILSHYLLKNKLNLE